MPTASTAAGTADRDAPAPALVDAARLRVAVLRLSRQLRRHELAGLTPTQLSALATIAHAGPLRLGDLAAAEHVAPSTLTRLVSALAERGYVLREAVPEDARGFVVQVTDAGRLLLDQIRRETTGQLTQSLRRLPDVERTALAQALPALERLAAVSGDTRPPASVSEEQAG